MFVPPVVFGEGPYALIAIPSFHCLKVIRAKQPKIFTITHESDGVDLTGVDGTTIRLSKYPTEDDMRKIVGDSCYEIYDARKRKSPADDGRAVRVKLT